MPSACTKPDNKASTEATNSVTQCIQIVEKKVRNLEKRKGRLDTYIDKRNEGNELNQDQEEAISKYDAVIQNLDFARELQKQFQGISNEIEKYLKRKAKRDKMERQEQEMSRIREVLRIQELLSNMGSDDVREDFKKGSHGAIVLTEDNLEQLDELYKLITPSREGETSYAEQLAHSSEHILSFMESREKEVKGTTYKQLNEMVHKINECGYFDNLANREEEETPEPEAPSEEQTLLPESNIPDPVESTEFQSPAQVMPEPEPIQVIEPVVPVIQQQPQQQPIQQQPLQQQPLQQQPLQQQPLQQQPLQQQQLQQQQQQHHQLPPQQQRSHVMPSSVAVGQSLVPDQDQVTGFEDDSFFTTAAQYTAPQQQPRAFQEIVSSVQGNFNFLQDSEIDIDSPQRIDPAVVAALPMRKPDALQQASYQGASLLSEDQSVSAAATYNQQVAAQNNQDLISQHAASQPIVSHVSSDSLDFGAASTPSMGESVQQSNTSSQLQFGESSSLAASSSSQQATSLEAYDQTYSQNLMSQSLGGSTSSQHVSSFGDQSASSMMSSHMNNLQDQSGSASSSSGPPQPIPLPSQSIPGQPLINQGFGATDSENSASQQQEKKPYTMNPNADPFQSAAMFSQSNMSEMSGQTSSSLPQSTPSTGSQSQETQRKPAWQTPATTQSEPQSTQQQNQQQADNSEYGNGPPRGGRGGSRGGGGRGMNNGFPRGASRGGAGYGNRNAGGYNSRGGGRGGGAWQGYPARNDYRPEGGYQGYNNGFNSGGMRGGPPRGGGMRGRGGSGGFNRGGGGNQPYSQQA